MGCGAGAKIRRLRDVYDLSKAKAVTEMGWNHANYVQATNTSIRSREPFAVLQLATKATYSLQLWALGDLFADTLSELDLCV